MLLVIDNFMEYTLNIHLCFLDVQAFKHAKLWKTSPRTDYLHIKLFLVVKFSDLCLCDCYVMIIVKYVIIVKKKNYETQKMSLFRLKTEYLFTSIFCLNGMLLKGNRFR